MSVRPLFLGSHFSETSVLLTPSLKSPSKSLVASQTRSVFVAIAQRPGSFILPLQPSLATCTLRHPLSTTSLARPRIVFKPLPSSLCWQCRLPPASGEPLLPHKGLLASPFTVVSFPSMCLVLFPPHSSAFVFLWCSVHGSSTALPVMTVTSACASPPGWQGAAQGRESGPGPLGPRDLLQNSVRSRDWCRKELTCSRKLSRSLGAGPPIPRPMRLPCSGHLQ